VTARNLVVGTVIGKLVLIEVGAVSSRYRCTGPECGGMEVSRNNVHMATTEGESSCKKCAKKNRRNASYLKRGKGAKRV
jgi:hypothetical protein